MPKTLTVLEVTQASDLAGCCTPLNGTPLSADAATGLARQLKALADPNRLRLLSLMLASADLEACTCDLTGVLGLSQPTVSHHLKILKEAGLVIADRKVGTWTYYRVVPEALRGVADLIAPAQVSQAGPRS